MTLLIEGSCPQLTQTILNLCYAENLRTVADFVTSDAENLSKKLKVPYKDILNIKRALIVKYAGFPQNGESLHNEVLESISILSTGSQRVNKFLNGGIYVGEVTEIHGASGSGKTQFCLSLVSNLLLETRNTAIYINVNDNFDGQQLEKILLNKSDNDQAVIQNLHKIKVKAIYNIYELFDFLDYIKKELCKKESSFFYHLKLIIIDSITNLLSPCFGGIGLDGPGMVSNVAQQFKILCSEHMLSVLVCNNVVGGKNYSTKPALGPSWKYVPSVSLSISKVDDVNRKMTVFKSCRNGLFNEVPFRITEAGISD